MTRRTCLDDLLRSLASRFDTVSDTPRTDAELLIEHVTGLTRTARYTQADRLLDPEDVHTIETLAERRLRGEPIAYLLGTQGFRNLLLAVSADVLIPRPETELLVERCLFQLASAPPGASACDLGTGSGAIALALAQECPGLRVTAVDCSAAALEIARANGARLGLDVEWLSGEWFLPLEGRSFGLIAANPPYIAEGDPHLSRGDVRFEPRTALAAGADGLADLRHIVATAPRHLEDGGWLVLEHGYDQGEAVRAVMHAAGYAHIATHRDLAGHDRITEGQWRRLATSRERAQ